MRALVVLGVVQTICIVFLLFKVVGDDRPTVAAESPSGMPSASSPFAAPTPLSEFQVRAIIREELDRRFPGDGTARPTPTPESRDPELDRRRMLAAERRIEQFKAMHTVGPEQMHAFQVEIGLLNDADRTRILRELVRAMNAGEIDGRLQ